MTDTVKNKPTKNIPTAKFVFLDILEKVKQWSNMYPEFEKGMKEGYKNPSSCFRKTGDGNDTTTTYDGIVTEMRDKIKAIAGTDWGKTYHTKMRAADGKEMERFNKNYMKKFGPLGLESLLLGNYEPLDDGIECGDKTEPDAKPEELSGGHFTNGDRRRSRRRRKHNKPCRKSRKKSSHIRSDS